jgi:hypothetical protein
LVHSLLDAGAFTGRYNFQYLHSLGYHLPAPERIRSQWEAAQEAQERWLSQSFLNESKTPVIDFTSYLGALLNYHDLQDASPYDSTLSTRRIGREENRETSVLLERLYAEGLIFPTGRKGEAHIDRVARAAILGLLPLVIRSHSNDHGLSQIIPITDRSDLYTALSRTLDLPPFRRTGDILQTHMRAISLDTSGAAVDDIMSFREERQPQFMRYMRTVEDVTRRIGAMEPGERATALADHEEEVDEVLKDIQAAAAHWGRPLGGLVLGLTGAAWTVIHGADPVGGALAGLGAILGFSPPGHTEAEFSYLFQVEKTFKRRRLEKTTPLILVEKKSRPRGSSQAYDRGDWIPHRWQDDS